MSKVVISPNLFLETNELKRNNFFIEEDGWKKFACSIVNQYGVANCPDETSFEIVQDSTNINAVNVLPGLAYDEEMQAIMNKQSQQFIMTNNGLKKWFVIKYVSTNIEAGTVSVNANGQITGIGTEFTKVLRGQPNFPTKVIFNSVVNDFEYEVVKVISDTQAIVAGNIINEANLQYSVVGTFTPGFLPPVQSRLIYLYDSCAITVIEQNNEPFLSPGQFLIGSVEFSSTSQLIIEDLRIYNMFNGNGGIYGGDQSDENPICSLIKTNPFPKFDNIELVFEHGYQINIFTTSGMDNSPTLTITGGTNNVLGNVPTTIPSGIFNGWVLLNRANMLSAKIIRNDNNKLLLNTNFNKQLLLNTGNDLVIIPNFMEIEFQAYVWNSATGQGKNDLKEPEKTYFFKFSLQNIINRFYVFVQPSYTNTVELKYRLISNSRQGIWRQFPIANFENQNKQQQVLSGSQFTLVPIIYSDSIIGG